jgi:hypothetical protein
MATKKDKTTKEGALDYMEVAFILVFIGNGARSAHLFRQMPMRPE